MLVVVVLFKDFSYLFERRKRELKKGEEQWERLSSRLQAVYGVGGGV